LISNKKVSGIFGIEVTLLGSNLLGASGKFSMLEELKHPPTARMKVKKRVWVKIIFLVFTF
jgi:hypothetical protein